LINYYEILGLGTDAGILEIKAAFRQLAKLYHPDVNPEGRERFIKILKAYEVLSDPALKSTYDYKLNYSLKQPIESKRSSGTKTWSFDEREIKRRQYYNEHIKKYAKETVTFETETEQKKSYNEFKYILFATPLAVVLFLLIMSLATRKKPALTKNSSASAIALKQVKELRPANTSDLKMGDNPYNLVFGNATHELYSDKKLLIKNHSGTDIIVCLFTKDRFIRSLFIKNDASTEVLQLPDDSLFINYSSGLYFNKAKVLKQTGVIGAFDKDLLFFKSIRACTINSINELTLMPGNNEQFEKTDELTFFKYAKKQL
jgi:curved DNA-binding protein CbpA